MFSLSLAGALGYILGSIPTAYVIVRWKSRLDIRNAGSGNVGTLNSYQVTGSATAAGAVLLVDFLKGAFGILLARTLWEGNFAHAAAAGLGLVAGHNFPVWLGFKGGRGLATGAGVFAILAWPVLASWCVIWGAGYLVLRAVNPANAVATVAVMVGVLFGSDALIGLLTGPGIPAWEFRTGTVAILTIILVKHTGPVREYFRERQGGQPPRKNDDAG